MRGKVKASANKTRNVRIRCGGTPWLNNRSGISGCHLPSLQRSEYVRASTYESSAERAGEAPAGSAETRAGSLSHRKNMIMVDRSTRIGTCDKSLISHGAPP